PGVQAGTVGRQQLGRAVDRVDVELLRHFLPPFNAPPAAAYANFQAVLDAGCGLGNPEHATRAALQLEVGAGVVVNLAPGDNCANRRSDALNFKASNEARKVVGVGANVAHYKALATLCRVHLP